MGGAPRALGSAPVDRRIGVLLNPNSGKGRVGRVAPDLIAALGARGDRVVVLQGDSAEHAHERVGAAVAAGLDALEAEWQALKRERG